MSDERRTPTGHPSRVATNELKNNIQLLLKPRRISVQENFWLKMAQKIQG